VTVALEPWNLYCKPVLPTHGGLLSSCGNAIGLFSGNAPFRGSAHTLLSQTSSNKVFPPGIVFSLAERVMHGDQIPASQVPLDFLVSR
jgi:hypothetical protein